MAMSDDYERQGVWLFRWRSYLPLLLIGMLAASLKEFSYPFNSHKLDLMWEAFCLSVSGIGVVVRVLTAGTVPGGTSGRTTKRLIARSLNATGVYSVVRHPLYLGNFFMFLGVALFYRFWWFSLVSVLLFIVYYERIMFAEEAFLRKQFGASFDEWARRIPAVIPSFRHWKQSELAFSVKTALKREYSSLFALVVTFTLLEIAGEYTVHGHFYLHPVWLIFFFCGLLGYVTMLVIHKKTNILKVEGR